MNVIKRDGRKVDFDKSKIENAIVKAMKNVGTIERQIAIDIANEIYEEVKNNNEVTIAQIELLVYNKLISKDRGLIAKAYEGYRSIREYQRNNKNTIDNEVSSLLKGENDYWNNENSNKNPRLNTTQRDYIAGIISKDISRRYLLPPNIVHAHDEGMIHIHDMDYLIQPMHNCFHSSTRFITDKGVKSFNECTDGEKVNVLTKDGEWKEATVRNYGKQKMQIVELTSCRKCNFDDDKCKNNNDAKHTLLHCKSVKIICTANHRWILEDGTVTTNLKEGMRLYPLGEAKINVLKWRISKISPLESEFDAWCVEEPETHSFTLDSDIVTGNCCLINLEDMLNNGTVISETLIEKPHSFSTACTVTTQIIAQVASSQYGGQSISLAHLAPFVDISRKKFRKEVIKELNDNGFIADSYDTSNIEGIVESRLKKEITKGIQTIQYQITTLMTTNG